MCRSGATYIDTDCWSSTKRKLHRIVTCSHHLTINNNHSLSVMCTYGYFCYDKMWISLLINYEMGDDNLNIILKCIDFLSVYLYDCLTEFVTGLTIFHFVIFHVLSQLQ